MQHLRESGQQRRGGRAGGAQRVARRAQQALGRAAVAARRRAIDRGRQQRPHARERLRDARRVAHVPARSPRNPHTLLCTCPIPQWYVAGRDCH